MGGDGAKVTSLNNQAQALERLKAEKTLAENERVRLAAFQKSQELAKADQDERRKDRELLQQLSNELTRLRVEAAAVVKAAAPAPAALTSPAPIAMAAHKPCHQSSSTRIARLW